MFTVLAQAGSCPLQKHGEAAAEIIKQANEIALYSDREGRDVITRALWKQIHETAAAWTGTLVEWLAWLDKWLPRVPCGDCRQHAHEWIKEHPPTLPPFAWTVEFHDSVNRRCGVAEMGIDAAGLLYPAKATAWTPEGDRVAAVPPVSGG
jgi:hypothetical protein